MESYRVILFTFFGECGLLHVCLNANRLCITRGETASGVSLGDLIKGDATPHSWNSILSILPCVLVTGSVIWLVRNFHYHHYHISQPPVGIYRESLL